MASATKYIYRRITSSNKKFVTKETLINGLIFDMDGTLTIPVLKFNVLRDRLGISNKVDILQYAGNVPEEEKTRIYEIIEDFEDEGIRNLKLQPNLHELFYFLRKENLKTALLTRNTRKAVDSFISKIINEDKREIFSKESDLFSMVCSVSVFI